MPSSVTAAFHEPTPLCADAPFSSTSLTNQAHKSSPCPHVSPPIWPRHSVIVSVGGIPIPACFSIVRVTHLSISKTNRWSSLLPECSSAAIQLPIQCPARHGMVRPQSICLSRFAVPNPRSPPPFMRCLRILFSLPSILLFFFYLLMKRDNRRSFHIVKRRSDSSTSNIDASTRSASYRLVAACFLFA